MATDSIVGGLFGIIPEGYQQQQNQQALRQSAELAQLDPMARARTGIMYGANRLVGALGGQDPQLQKISAIQSLGQQFDVTTPEGLMQAAGAIRNQYPDVAFGLSQKAQELGLARAKTQKETLSIQQEEKLRSELAGLGPNATQADVLRTVTKFGSPDKILAVLESSNRAREGNETRLQIAEGQQKTQLQSGRGSN